VSVLRGPGHDPGEADREREAAVQARVEEMLSSPEALMEGIARSDAGEFAGPDADARFARFLSEQPDERLAALGRALERGERPSALLSSEQFAPLREEGARALRETDARELVRTIAEHDRSLRRD
jgi:hypothetical protein